GMRHAYGPQPPYYYQNRSLVNLCTRSLPVVWPPKADVKGMDSCTKSEPAPERPIRDLVKKTRKREDEKDACSRERTIFMKDT
ncbi:hypothetical protein J3R83DRAFT_10682, partial [Lanmaoa asiatica]